MSIARNRIKSAWTPLSNEQTNNKLFEERKDLINKWYQKWTDEQRKHVLEDLLTLSKRRQLEFVRDIVHCRVHPANVDFTRVLRRDICLYIFSFLDPTSLCRAAQVCWYWHDLCERDELWMPRCIQVGWFLPFTPSPFECGIWKRLFVENIKMLIILAPRRPPKLTLTKMSSTERRNPKEKKTPVHVPWRGSDPVPKDIWRFNVLENDEIIKSVQKMRKKGAYGTEVDLLVSKAHSKVNTGNNILNTIRRSQSLSRMNAGITTATSSDRPAWAQQREVTLSGSGSTLEAAVKVGTQPTPGNSLKKATRPVSARPIPARTPRDPPSQDLFPDMPWRVPDRGTQ